MSTVEETAKQVDLFRHYGITVSEVVLQRGDSIMLELSSGVAATVTVVKGYGYLFTANVQIELKPGRVIDVSSYTGKGKEFGIKATSEKGMEMVRADISYYAG